MVRRLSMSAALVATLGFPSSLAAEMDPTFSFSEPVSTLATGAVLLLLAATTRRTAAGKS